MLIEELNGGNGKRTSNSGDVKTVQLQQRKGALVAR